MTLNQVRYVSEIAVHKNISQAAKSLYLSQPALTKSINSLEEELGVTLFDRTKSPVEITYAGTVFLERGSNILSEIECLEGEMAAIATCQKGEIVIGIPGERGASWLPHLLPLFGEQYPDVKVKVIEGHSNVLEEKMLAGEIDFSLYTLPIMSAEIDFQVLADDPIVIIAGRTSPFAQQFDLSKNSIYSPYIIPSHMLDGQNFLMVKQGSGMRRVTEYLLERYGVKCELKRELYRHQTVVQLVAVGDGLAVSPCVTPLKTGIEDQLAYFTLDNPVLSRKIVVAHRKNKQITKPMEDFIELTREMLEQVPILTVQGVVPVQAP